MPSERSAIIGFCESCSGHGVIDGYAIGDAFFQVCGSCAPRASDAIHDAILH